MKTILDQVVPHESTFSNRPALVLERSLRQRAKARYQRPRSSLGPGILSNPLALSDRREAHGRSFAWLHDQEGDRRS